jgi:hypothetical protein
MTLPWTCGLSVSVVHQDRAGGREVDAKAGRDLHDTVAACDHRGRERAALGPEHVSRVERVTKAGQLDRLVQELDPDQLAAARQHQLLNASEAVERQLQLGLRCVGKRAGHGVMGIDQEHEAGAEGVRRADQIAEVHRLADALGADPEIAAHRFFLTSRARVGQGLRRLSRGFPGGAPAG